MRMAFFKPPAVPLTSDKTLFALRSSLLEEGETFVGGIAGGMWGHDSRAGILLRSIIVDVHRVPSLLPTLAHSLNIRPPSQSLANLRLRAVAMLFHVSPSCLSATSRELLKPFQGGSLSAPARTSIFSSISRTLL